LFNADPLDRPSDADTTRTAGAQQFERVAAGLRSYVDRYSRMVERFRDVCVHEQVAGADVRSFTWQQASALVTDDRVVATECLQFRAEIVQLRDGIREALGAAEEEARKAGVYPGTLRDLRQRHGLDWDGWDR
jgi:hypothetical protein